MSLRLNSDHLQQIQAHAESTYPHECCGLLLGQAVLAESDTWAVVEVWQTQNSWSDQVAHDLAEVDLAGVVNDNLPLSRSRRYWIDPKEMLAGQRYARDRHLTIIGIYHSHPDHPAEPSECDRALAWSDYSYLIVSVRQGYAQNLLSWRLDSDHQFQPELILT